MPETIGIILKRAREEKGLELEQIAKELRVRLKYLLEVENANADDCFDYDVYSLGYIKMYATYLNVDIEKHLPALPPTNSDFAPIDQNSLEQSKPPLLTVGVSSVLAILSLLILLLFNRDTIAENGSHDKKDAPIPDQARLFLSNNQYILNNGKTPNVIAALALQDSLLKIKDAQDKDLVQREIRSGESFVLPQQENLIIEIDSPNSLEFYEFSLMNLHKKKLLPTAVN